MKPTLKAWLRFNAVGALGFLLQLGILTVLKSRLNFHYLTATFLAVEAAVLHNFIWHERWTWAHRGLGIPGVFIRLLRFNAANGLISIAGNLAITWLLVSRFHIHYVAANIAAIACCSLVNFLVSDRLVFRPSL